VWGTLWSLKKTGCWSIGIFRQEPESLWPSQTAHVNSKYSALNWLYSDTDVHIGYLAIHICCSCYGQLRGANSCRWSGIHSLCHPLAHIAVFPQFHDGRVVHCFCVWHHGSQAVLRHRWDHQGRFLERAHHVAGHNISKLTITPGPPSGVSDLVFSLLWDIAQPYSRNACVGFTMGDLWVGFSHTIP